MTTVSVIIPCLDAEPYVGPAIHSVLNQTRPPSEVIVVDNGSSDGSYETARSFGGIVQSVYAPAGNACHARLEGVERASGDALMFLDADDLLGPHALEELSAVISRDPDAVACCPWRRLEKIGDGWHSSPASCAPRQVGQDDLGAWLTGWYHPPCSVLWSRVAYVRSGGWDPGVHVNQDGDIMMRGLIAGNRLRRTAGGVAYYRRPAPGDRSLSGRRMTPEGLEARHLVLRRVEDGLRDQDRLERYRCPLGDAYAVLARESADIHPALSAEALADLGRVAGRTWSRRKCRFARRIARKATHIHSRFDAAFGASQPRARDVDNDVSAEGGSGTALRGQRPRVSVIVPTYNRRTLLSRALDSVFAQSYPNFELLVVDDGSTDGTEDLITGYSDSRLRYLRQPEQRGVAAARNRGIRESTGSLIAFLDSDDEWLPDRLASTVERFESAPLSVGLVYCGVETVATDKTRRVDLPRHRGWVHNQLLRGNFLVGGSCAAIRRLVVDTVGYFDEILPAIEDYDYWLRVSRFYKFEYVAEAHIRYYDETVGSRGAERRSRLFGANFQARDIFLCRNRHELAEARVAHLFLLESGLRHLRWPSGDRSKGCKLLWQALRTRPASLELYAALIHALPPLCGIPVPRELFRKLRAGLPTGTGSAAKPSGGS